MGMLRVAARAAEAGSFRPNVDLSGQGSEVRNRAFSGGSHTLDPSADVVT